jgi:hypothetical protein
VCPTAPDGPRDMHTNYGRCFSRKPATSLPFPVQGILVPCKGTSSSSGLNSCPFSSSKACSTALDGPQDMRTHFTAAVSVEPAMTLPLPVPGHFDTKVRRLNSILVCFLSFKACPAALDGPRDTRTNFTAVVSVAIESPQRRCLSQSRLGHFDAPCQAHSCPFSSI